LRAVEIGLCMFPTDYAIRPAELGRLAEEHGFDALLVPEHTHIPTSRKSPWPGGGDLPKEYSHTYDPFVALGTVAEATEQLKIGTGICLVVERDPITTAKEVASIDRLSDGRFLFGVGAGWNREEMENHGTDPSRRFSLMRERIEAMKAIWTEDEAEYHGEHVDFDPVWAWPKPVQQPHPPILVGGNGAKVVDRVVAYGDEWMPNVGRSGIDELAERIRELHEKAAAAGREGLRVSGFAAPRDAESVERLREAGFDRLFWYVPPEPREQAVPRIERYAERRREISG
jgi:probable F420-dependent oxidoreductase